MRRIPPQASVKKAVFAALPEALRRASGDGAYPFSGLAEALPRLSLDEVAFLRGTPAGRSRWDAQRVELNAFTSDALIAFVEAKLRQHGLARKVCPPAAVVAEAASGVEAQVSRLPSTAGLGRRCIRHPATRLWGKSRTDGFFHGR